MGNAAVNLEQDSIASAMPRRRRWVGTPTVSLAVSLLLHALLLAGAAAVVWRTALAPPARLPGALTFEAPGDSTPALGTIGARDDETRRDRASGAHAMADHEVRIELLGATDPAPDAPLRGLASSVPEAAPVPGAPAAAESGAVVGGVSSMLGSGVAHAPGGGTPTAGVAEGSASVTFAGLGASGVESVVYVVDCSGSMVTSLPMVIAELERSISRLSPTQKFGVVLFRRTSEGAPATDAFAPVLMRPTPSARKLLREWLSRIEPSGRSSPLAGLEHALALRPDAVFLLSRSIQRSGGGVWDQGLEATMARLEELNPMTNRGRRDVLIQTIQFLDEDPTGILPAIGERHGGGRGYRVIARQQDLAPSALE